MSNNLAGESIEETVPQVSVVICTRNRGASIVQTLDSVFANDHPPFEVIVVDQSTNNETEAAVAPYCQDPRFRYIRSDTVGTGKSRNIGLRAAQGDIVAYTDDDCTVPVDWLERLDQFFSENLQIAVGFCSVIPGPHDAKLGTIPNHQYAHDRVICKLRDYYSSIGMGAGMILRRTVALSFGGFDDQLGPGSKFLSAEDHDIAIRALIYNHCVCEISTTWVIHDGFRTYTEFKELTRRDFIAMGAVHGKYLRRFQLSIVALIVYNSLFRGFLQPLLELKEFRRPRGFKRVFYLWKGILLGISTPVNSANFCFTGS
jgi:glycosyltransferase involved in cell wall biosynthesis